MIQCHGCRSRVSSTVIYCSACAGGPPKTWPPVVLDEAALRARAEAIRLYLRELHDRGPLPLLDASEALFQQRARTGVRIALRPTVPPADTSWIKTTEPPLRRSWWKFWRSNG